jgi:cytoskeletal protein CcmA (bactofilin family)
MTSNAQIGPSIHIKGEVTAQEPLTIAGHVDGSVQVTGHSLTVAPEGHVNANINADTIVVGGRVYGKLQAASRIVVHQTATIEGDLIAPAISLAEGANVQGRVETAARSKKVLSLAS